MRNTISRTLEHNGIVKLHIYDDCGNIIKKIETDHLGKIYYAIRNIDDDQTYKIVNANNSPTFSDYIEHTINNS